MQRPGRNPRHCAGRRRRCHRARLPAEIHWHGALPDASKSRQSIVLDGDTD